MGRALLIGGAGFIGAHLARELLERGDEVVVLDDDRSYLPGAEPSVARVRLWRRQTLLSGAAILRGGPDEPARLRDDLDAVAPDIVVHLANLPLAAVARRDQAEAWRSIVGGTTEVLSAVAERAPGARLVFVSSSMVYGDFTADPQPETAPLRPREPYGRCKLEAEQRVRASPLDWTIVRPSAVYGPGDANGRFLQRLADAAARQRPLELTAADTTRLDFTWVGDLAIGLAQAATSPAASQRTFNLTAGRARSLADAIDIVRALGHRVDVRAGAVSSFRPTRGTLDIAHAREAFGYAPSWSLEDGLAAYLDTVAAEPLAA